MSQVVEINNPVVSKIMPRVVDIKNAKIMHHQLLVLDNVNFEAHPVFGMMMPTECPGVPSEVLNPRNTWANKDQYDIKAKQLAAEFIKNFEKYASGVTEEILNAAPTI